MASAAPTARSVQGALVLRFARAGSRTVLTEARRAPPWTVQRLLHLDAARPALASAVLVNATAGLFAGDHLSLAVTVKAGAAVDLTTPTQSRAYTMPDGEADIETVLRVESGAFFSYLPEPLLLCAGAAVSQRTTVEAAADAWAVAGEVVAFGRAGHGELHAYRALTQTAEFWSEGRLVLADALRLHPATDSTAPAVVGGMAAYGSLVCLCPQGRSPGLLDALRAALVPRAQVLAAASLLMDGTGVSVRVLAGSAFVAQQMLRSAAAIIREHALPLHP